VIRQKYFLFKIADSQFPEKLSQTHLKSEYFLLFNIFIIIYMSDSELTIIKLKKYAGDLHLKKLLIKITRDLNTTVTMINHHSSFFCSH
jgi:hypothetical protein